jgi:hypothetical protein
VKKGIIFILLIVFVLFAGAGTVSAASYFNFGKMFGGKIIYPKASEIQELEDFGYTCTIPGTTISIVPMGSPASTTATDFFIPSFVTSKSRTTPRSGQLIVGRYAGKTTITCIQQIDEVEDIQTVILDTINLFATSK